MNHTGSNDKQTLYDGLKHCFQQANIYQHYQHWFEELEARQVHMAFPGRQHRLLHDALLALASFKQIDFHVRQYLTEKESSQVWLDNVSTHVIPLLKD